jgi:demethylspheroidene O-methyltransferase
MTTPALAAHHTPSRMEQGWRERWIRLRNGLIESERFRRWAVAFPPTRPIARRRVRALFDLVAGFVYSQVLSACVQARLLDLLAEGPQSAVALAPRLDLAEAAAETLLKAATALALAERLGDGRYMLGHLGAALRGNPSVQAMIAHHGMLYADLADPLALLRGETEPSLARFWSYATSNAPAAAAASEVLAYSRLMADSQALVADEVLSAYSLSRHRRLLDIGGGEAAFLTAAGRRFPDLDLVLFDLPAVAERARVRISAAGLSARTTVRGGSFLADPLPDGADVASLVRVLHDHDDAAAMRILLAARAALARGGVLLVAEPMSGTRGAEPIGDAYFGFYLAAMRSGRPRTSEELATMLKTAGFRDVREVPTRTPLIVRVLVATA